MALFQLNFFLRGDGTKFCVVRCTCLLTFFLHSLTCEGSNVACAVSRFSTNHIDSSGGISRSYCAALLILHSCLRWFGEAVLAGRQEEHLACINWVMRCRHVVFGARGQLICIWFSWCYVHPIISCFIKMQKVCSSFWCQLTHITPLNACLSIYWYCRLLVSGCRLNFCLVICPFMFGFDSCILLWQTPGVGIKLIFML